MRKKRTVTLGFGQEERASDTHTNLSAVRAEGEWLWVAGDETATVERLRADDKDRPSRYAGARSFRLADLVDLPGAAEDEADIEGLARDEGFLWAVGSHSLKRKRVKDNYSDAKAVKRLAKIEDETNRRILVRIPVVMDDEGSPVLAKQIQVDGEHHVAAVLGGAAGRSLSDLLADDAHLGPFLSIPSKDNGLYIEGVAACGQRLFLGLRGPVLRGWAVVLELQPYVDDAEPTRLRLADLDGAPYRKHFLDLQGLGVRDLCQHGDDLLVLAGPTMDLDGPVRLYRWLGAASQPASTVVRGEEITRVLDLAYGEGDDHAEGMTLLPGADGDDLLVVYDSPAPERLTDDGSVLADVLTLP